MKIPGYRAFEGFFMARFDSWERKKNYWRRSFDKTM